MAEEWMTLKNVFNSINLFSECPYPSSLEWGDILMWMELPDYESDPNDNALG